MTQKELEAFCFYESGLSADGCLENLDRYARSAIEKYGRLLVKNLTASPSKKPTKPAKSSTKPSTKSQLIQTDLAFVRNDAFGIERLLALRFTHTLKTKKDVVRALRQGVTAWIENYPSGLKAWEESSEDFNIGDFCSTEDFQLQACLEARGILSVETLYELCQGEDLSYDSALACPNMKPEALYRQDGERFSRNHHGYYSLDSSEMKPPYSYSYSDLMESGYFSRQDPTKTDSTKSKKSARTSPQKSRPPQNGPKSPKKSPKKSQKKSPKKSPSDNLKE